MKKIFLFVGVLLTVVCVLFSCSAEDTVSVSLEEYDFFIYPSSDLESSDAEEEAISSDEESEDSSVVEVAYILNKKTRKFHYPECRSVKLMKEENMLYQIGNRDDIIYTDFSPCQHCMP